MNEMCGRQTGRQHFDHSTSAPTRRHRPATPRSNAWPAFRAYDSRNPGPDQPGEPPAQPAQRRPISQGPESLRRSWDRLFAGREEALQGCPILISGAP